VRLFAEIGGLGRAVDVRILQYGVTRQRLRDVLEEGEGWDVIHVSGHGAPGELVLETEDGSPDRVAAAELVDLLDLARERVKLVTVSACWLAALTLAEQRRLLKLPVRDDFRAEQAKPVLAGEPQRAGGLEPGRAGGLEPAGVLAATLVDRLGCGVLAMRYPVVDDFAIALAEKLYDLLAGKGQPLPRALGIALKDREVIADPPTAGCPALSVATPALFGERAVGLRLAAPQRGGPVSYDTRLLKLAGFPPQPGRFVGRTAVMARASAALAPRSGAAGVLLHGMPGGGKTACALELAYTHEHAFERLVWFKAPDEGLDIADALTRFGLSLEAGLPGLQMVHLLENQARLAAFLPELTELLERHRVLVVVDNIESLLTESGQWRDARWAMVVAAMTGHGGLGRVVLTSRRTPDDLDGRMLALAVDVLSADEALLLARELPHLRTLMDGDLAGVGPDVARQLAVKVLEVARGHPKLLELADGQLEVAGLRAARAGGGTSGVAGVDQVAEGAAGPVGALSLGVVAGAADDWGEGEVKRPQEGRGLLARGPAVLAGGAGVSRGGAVGVQGGHAPAGLRVPGRGGDQGTRVLRIDEAEPVGFAARSRVTVQGGQGHGDGDLRGQARARIRLSRAAGAVRSGAVRPGPAWPVRPGIGAVVPVRAGVPVQVTDRVRIGVPV
jgi:hypothetical protein